MALSDDQSLNKALINLNAREPSETEFACKKIPVDSSKNKTFIEGYLELRSGTVSEVSSNAAQPQELLDELVSFCIQARFEEVVSKAEFFVALFSNDISLHNILGVANAALRRHNAAIESYKQVLKINPNCEAAYNDMGNALTEMGELEAAVECYKKAIEIKPDHAEAYSNMGFVLKSKFDLDTALYDHIKRAFKI